VGAATAMSVILRLTDTPRPAMRIERTEAGHSKLDADRST